MRPRPETTAVIDPTQYTVTGTKKGWVIKNGKKGTMGPFRQLYGVSCNIVDGPRDPYLFFRDELKKLRVSA